jgi:two-component system nitrate/nitrite response regulator NarL
MSGEPNAGSHVGGAEPPATRVCVVTGVRIYRDGITRFIEELDGLSVVCATSPGQMAVEQAAAERADLVLVDVSAPEGLAMLRPLAERLPEAKIVALLVPEREWDVLECARAGVVGYVSRDATGGEFSDALAGAVRGELRCPPRIAAILRHRIAMLASAHLSGAAAAHLTVRESEIVRLVSANLSNREIAQRLSIEESTVKNHVHNILEKMHVRRRSDVAKQLGGREVGESELPL